MLQASVTCQDNGRKCVSVRRTLSSKGARVWRFWHVYSFLKNKVQVNLEPPSYMHTIYFYFFPPKIEIPHFEKGKIVSLRKRKCGEYSDVIGRWKWHFISFEVSIKLTPYLS
jgi:hypothetical protein